MRARLRIDSLSALEILDSRGHPTSAVELFMDSGRSPGAGSGPWPNGALRMSMVMGLTATADVSADGLYRLSVLGVRPSMVAGRGGASGQPRGCS